MWALVKCVLVLSHGNADPERGFSINKHLIDIHGCNIGEETIEAIRLVKDHIIKSGGLEYVSITKKMLNMCGNASSKYKEYLQVKEQLAQKEAAADKANEEAVALEQKDKEKTEKLREIDVDMRFIRTAIGIADQSVVEGNDNLSCCIRSKTLDRKKIEQAQAKIDMGIKRKAKLVSEMVLIEKKKSKLEHKKH